MRIIRGSWMWMAAAATAIFINPTFLQHGRTHYDGQDQDATTARVDNRQ
jgi:hypothetical protein